MINDSIHAGIGAAQGCTIGLPSSSTLAQSGPQEAPNFECIASNSLSNPTITGLSFMLSTTSVIVTFVVAPDVCGCRTMPSAGSPVVLDGSNDGNEASNELMSPDSPASEEDGTYAMPSSILWEEAEACRHKQHK